MGVNENKALLRQAFAELAKGDGSVLLEALADDVQWTIIGTTSLSQTFNGKQAVIDKLLVPFSNALEGHIHITPDNIIGEGDYIVVQGRGEAITKIGIPYNNTYCWVYRFAHGKIVALTEYLDTELLRRAFG